MLDYRVHTFLAVYRSRSFTQAARELHITQPAVSQHIRHLERHYGARLFEKTTRGAEPTEAGRTLYRALSVMENDEQRLCAELRAGAQGADATPLHLGCTRTVADYAVPRILAQRAAALPAKPICMRVGNTAELLALMDTGEVDCALVEGSFDRTAFDFAVFSREPFIAVASPEQAERLRAGGAQGIEGLLGARLILREAGSGTRDILERNLAAHDLGTGDFAGVIELASIPAILACVEAGAGISFLYRIAAERELAAGALVDITPRDFTIEHDFSLVWQRGSIYADSYRALLRAWRKVAGAGEVR